MTELTEATAENAALRDLLAAVSEIAGSVPQAVSRDHFKELVRATDALIDIKHAARVTGSGSVLVDSARFGAAELRKEAAKPVKYEVWQAPAETADATAEAAAERGEHPYPQTCGGRPYPAGASGDRSYCWRPDGHDGPHYDEVDKLHWLELEPEVAHVPNHDDDCNGDCDAFYAERNKS